MIPVLRRDQQTKSPLFLFSPLFSSHSSSLILLWKHSCSHLLHQRRKKSFFPRIPCRATSYSLFWALPEEQEALWCRHISSVLPLCSLSLFLDNRFLPTEQRTGKNQSHATGVCICVCERQRQMKNIAAENVNIFTYLASAPNIRAHWFALTRLRHAITLTHPYCKCFRQLPKCTRDNRAIWQSAGLFELISAYLSN